MYEKMRTFFKSRAGMTYVELVVALGLLCLIIVSFTPMLLKSYQTLYGAGELNEATYEGKQELEEGLADRAANRNVKGVNVSLSSNASELMSNFYLGLRNITASTQYSLETLFFGGKGRLNVLTSSVMRDDYDAKRIVVQAEGVHISSLKAGDPLSLSTTAPKGTAVVRVYMPDYLAASSEDGFLDKYVGGVEGTKFLKLDKEKGTYIESDNFFVEGSDTFEIVISGVDITTPVLKIVMAYVDENSRVQQLDTVVYIEPATITIAGATSGTPGAQGSIAYYTTAGVETKKSEDAEGTAGSFTERFKVEGRKMTFPDEDMVKNAAELGYKYPSGTTFLNVQWVDNDDAKDLNPYYVLTGDNGVIQRLYITNAKAQTVGKTFTSRANIADSALPGFPFDNDGLSDFAYPTVWGGDKSHQFSFSTATGKDDHHIAAYSRGSWLTSNGTDSDGFPSFKGQSGVYNNQARMAFYFNGFRFTTEGDERMRDGRRISYIIAETDYPLRFIGARGQSGENWGGFITPWEGPYDNTDKENYGTEYHHDMVTSTFTFKKSNPQVLLWNRYYDNKLNWDEALSYINLKGYTNISPQKAMISSKDEIGDDSGAPPNYISDNNATNIRITGSYYNPVTNDMRYLGSSIAYAYIQQADNTGIRYDGDKFQTGRKDNANEYQFCRFLSAKGLHPLGSMTGYLVCGSSFDGTTIYKYSSLGTVSSYEAPVTNLYNNYEDVSAAYNGQDAAFYVNRNEDNYSATKDTDLEFTLGYSSNREEVFASVTYGTDKTEYQASYERFFNLSHYAITNYQENVGSLNYYQHFNKNMKNSIYNPCYHVWFPGEFYNLIKTATKEGVTVAVGYTVSGSTYQWVDPSHTGNTSTALGSLYNDAVLAAVVDASATADGAFKNLLYYKDYSWSTFQHANIVNNGVSSYGDNYKTCYGSYDSNGSTIKNYGTHARQSVRFEAVDIAVVENRSSTTGAGTFEKGYYAFYGDNHGRVYYSKVASLTGSYDPAQDNPNTEEIEGIEEGTPTLVTAIQDLYPEPVYDTSSFGRQTEIMAVKDNQSGSISNCFTKITTIYCEGNVVIICGTKASGAGVVMGRIKDDGTIDRFEYFDIVPAGDFEVKDALILNGYLYLIGRTGAKGFVAAFQYAHLESYMTMDDIVYNKDAEGNIIGNPITTRAEQRGNAVNTLTKNIPYQELPTIVYSIAGHA